MAMRKRLLTGLSLFSQNYIRTNNK
uniref:Uncharacterized protein n=1 Tax=Anguilla anguilla TaxID=7936 RepID=A0A0E9QJ17_ANGAN